MRRTIMVKELKMDSITSASILHVGDSAVIRPLNWVLALQREVPFFIEGEGGFSNYPLFWEPIPQPSLDNEVYLTRCNEQGAIHVCGVDVSAIAASSVVQLGNSCRVDAEARIVNIRQLLRGERPVGPPNEEEDETD
ncbi:MAG: gerPE [Paenibacillus sp.]|nr:gerPE [Paenibacillus sp.]